MKYALLFFLTLTSWASLLLAGSGFAKDAPTPISTSTLGGSVEFVATGKPSALKIHGQGDGLSGKIEIKGTEVTGSADFPVTHFSTGVELRDKHMKEKYLQVEQYATGHLVLSAITFSKPITTPHFQEKEVAFKGELTLHGVTHSVSGTVGLKATENHGIESHVDETRFKGDAQFEIKISDYKIEVPKYLGITVADSVLITAHFETTPTKATP